MPRSLSKPSKQEVKAAIEMQAPGNKPKKRETITQVEATPIPKMLSLGDAGIDTSQKTYIKIASLFPDEDALVSEPFLMTNAVVRPNNLKPGTNQIDFSITTLQTDETGHSDFKISLSPDDSRMAFVNHFAHNQVPLGYLVLVKLPATKQGFADYYQFQQAEKDDLPF